MKILGVIGNDMVSLEATGQLERYTDYYLRHWVACFDEIILFSRHPHKSIATYNGKIRIVPPLFKMNDFIQNNVFQWLHPEMHKCNILRVMHMTSSSTAVFIKLLYGIPFIATFGYDYSAFVWLSSKPKILLFLKWLYTTLTVRLGIRFADAIIATSPDTMQLLNKFPYREKVYFVPNGVDTNLFRPIDNRSGKWSRKNLKLLFIGRLEKQKNLFMLLESIGIVQRKTPVALTIIGEGSLKGIIITYARRLGISLTMKGVVPNMALPDLMNEHDIFVLPSFCEGHPKVLIEAMSCGMACIGTKVPGIASLISDRQTGLLADLTTDSFAERLAALIKDANLRRRLGRAAREYIVENFDLNKLLRRETSLLAGFSKRR